MFCSQEHKTIANNRKAAERKARVLGQNLRLELNAQIIYEQCLGKPTPIKIEKEKLLKAGFKSDGPSIPIRAADNTIWSQIGNYIIGTDISSSLVTLMTVEDFKKL